MIGRIKRWFCGPDKPRFEDRRDWSWHVGELAVCVGVNWSEPGGLHPNPGDVQRVTRVQDKPPRAAPEVLHTMLSFAEFGDWEFSSNAFRKAVSDTQPAEAEFTALIRKGKSAPAREVVQ